MCIASDVYQRTFNTNGYIHTERFRVVHTEQSGVWLAHEFYSGDFETLRRTNSCFYVNNDYLTKYYRTTK